MLLVLGGLGGEEAGGPYPREDHKEGVSTFLIHVELSKDCCPLPLVTYTVYTPADVANWVK